jgi:hypothetical protein
VVVAREHGTVQPPNPVADRVQAALQAVAVELLNNLRNRIQVLQLMQDFLAQPPGLQVLLAL